MLVLIQAAMVNVHFPISKVWRWGEEVLEHYADVSHFITDEASEGN